MKDNKKQYVCPAELAGSLDNIFRRLVHKPGKILKPYINKGMTVLDLGCGPGYFTAELARLAGEGGRILIVEPKIHVTEKGFNRMINRLEAAKLGIIEKPKISLSRTVLVRTSNN